MEKITREHLIFLQHELEQTLIIRTEFRRGQAFFNLLHFYEPDIADEIRGTKLDPFYDDSRLEKLYNYITEEDKLEEEPEFIL